MIIILIFFILWGGVGGLDWIFDIINCINLEVLILEDKNDVILNNLFLELYHLMLKEDYLNYLKNLEVLYNIDLNNVNDMTYEIQEKIKIDLNKILKEIKENQ